MRLLLTSSGLSTETLEKTFQSLLTKPPEENKALIMGVHPGIEGFDFDAYIDRNVQMLVKQGLLEKNIECYKLDDDNPPSLNNIDILWMLGGSEYRHMKWIRKQGLVPEIRKFIENNGLYSGRSAGAIIMGPDVDIEHWSNTPNDVGLEDTTGFGYVDFITAPHVDSTLNGKKAIEFHKNTGYKMIYLTNKQGILVVDDMYKII
jgi:dipeptidase E